MKEFINHISINPEVRFGKPCITGTRISVSDVLGWFASGLSEREILEDFSYLTSEQIRAALLFAAYRQDHIKIVAA
jgi:uncharacterized protein (DUF433 family)